MAENANRAKYLAFERVTVSIVAVVAGMAVIAVNLLGVLTLGLLQHRMTQSSHHLNRLGKGGDIS